METTIELGALLVRDGRVFLSAAGEGWALPGGALPSAAADMDEAMAEALSALGVEVTEVEESFLDTVYLPRTDGHALLNVYAPADWQATPHASSAGAWHAVEAVGSLAMEPGLRDALQLMLGLREATPGSFAEGPISDFLASFAGRPALGLSERERALVRLGAMAAAAAEERVLRAQADAAMAAGASAVDVEETLAIAAAVRSAHQPVAAAMTGTAATRRP